MQQIICKSRTEWLERRMEGLGASDASVVLGLNPWKSAMELFGEKAGLLPLNPEETEAMEWGHLLEPVLAKKYERETGRLTTDPGDYTIQVDEELPFLLSTLDRIIEPAPGHPETPHLVNGERGDLELKTTSEFKRDDWAEEPPLFYQVQVQHQLMVTGLRWASIAVLIGGRSFLWQDIRRNDEFISYLRKREVQFWRRVQANDPPEIDGSDRTAEAIKAIFPRETTAAIVELDASSLTWADELERCKQVEKEVLAAKTLAENHLKAAIGVAQGGLLPDGRIYTWKEQKRAAYSVPEGSMRVLRKKGGK